MGAAVRLVAFVKTFSRFFHTRSESNTVEIRAYLFGLMQGKRGAKNIERMEEHVPGFKYQNVHHAISHSPWDPRALMDEIARRASGLLGGGARTRLVVDDTGIQKKGDASVGVARQYIGRLGKIENCQIAVCTSLAAGQRSTLSDIRLYLPEDWCRDGTRCERAGIPEDECVFRTKGELALESIRHQRELGVEFDVVNMDSGYGSDPGFLHALDRDGETFVAEVHCNQTVWREHPWPHCEGKRPGSTLKHPRPSHPGQRVDQWAGEQPEGEWRRLKIRDSDRGWVEVSYLSGRVWVNEGERVHCRWLLVWENPDESSNEGRRAKAPRRHYALSNSSADTDSRLLMQDAVGRNVVERNFRDGKSEVGMADYQTRGWLAWQHHMSLVMLGMLFLIQERMHTLTPTTTEGPVDITSGDIVFVLERLLPQRVFGAAAADEVERMLRKRIAKRIRDQTRRRAKTRAARPPLWQDETVPI